jgi:uncharacterized protein (DUF2147 family)
MWPSVLNDLLACYCTGAEATTVVQIQIQDTVFILYTYSYTRDHRCFKGYYYNWEQNGKYSCMEVPTDHLLAPF